MILAVPAALQAFFAEHPHLALAFSGGCDSAYLLYAAKACGAELGVYYVHSCFQPAFELADAQKLTKQLGQDMTILNVDVLSDEQVRSNPENRCYYCKKTIFGSIMRAAKSDGYDTIIDGTNASDDASDRPGMRALAEMQVLSPLRLCGITKAQVRQLSREAGLFTWNKPSYACLATRIPAGVPIEGEMLARVERSENRLAGLGFSDFRVRVTEKGARLEIRAEQLPLLTEKHSAVLAALDPEFNEITLNLRLRKERET